MELFEAIRREYQFGVGTIKGVARKLGIHRRMVREALADAVPKERKIVERVRPKLEPAIPFIDTILETDLNAPRKQRHTARRIFDRLRIEKPCIEVAEATVRAYVREKKLKIGLIHREIFVPQSYTLGQEGEVDWYEMFAELGGERQKVQIFCLRSMGSAGAFHRAYPHASQQAFLEGHELAFHYFGGVFHLLRYDNLKSAVQRILRGSQREETARFIAWLSALQQRLELARIAFLDEAVGSCPSGNETLRAFKPCSLSRRGSHCAACWPLPWMSARAARRNVCTDR